MRIQLLHLLPIISARSPCVGYLSAGLQGHRDSYYIHLLLILSSRKRACPIESSAF